MKIVDDHPNLEIIATSNVTIDHVYTESEVDITECEKCDVIVSNFPIKINDPHFPTEITVLNNDTIIRLKDNPDVECDYQKGVGYKEIYCPCVETNITVCKYDCKGEYVEKNEDGCYISCPSHKHLVLNEEKNDCVCVGTKQELRLRVAWMMKNGVPERCPECHGGRLKRTAEGTYFCPGSFDDDQYIRCSYTTDNPTVKPWVKEEGCLI